MGIDLELGREYVVSMNDSSSSELLPSIAQILREAGSLERVSVDILAVSRLPVFQSTSWKNSIGEFLRWSGSTPDPWSASSVFDLLLCHGAGGARAIFEAYRRDRLERAASFEEAQTQLEAVRTVVSMAAYWQQAIPWDLREEPRLSPDEFRSRRLDTRAGVGDNAASDAAPRDRGEAGLRERADGPSNERTDAAAAGRSAPTGVPVFPQEPGEPTLWKPGTEKLAKLRPPRP
jgi:hypothetical protein